MTLPAFLFGFLISVMAGAAFHLWKGGGLFRLLMYLLFSLIGFWSGHAISVAIGWDFWVLGPLHMGFAIIGTILILALGYWLSLIGPNIPLRKTH
jgi:hypothetical protein